MASDTDRIRLAVALSALKFKPANQSFTAYVLDLRTRFTLPSLEVASDELWRNFALKIERDYKTLEEKYDAERIRCLSLENALVTSTPALIVEPEQRTAPKKKARKRPVLPAATTAEKCPDVLVARVDLTSVLKKLTVSHAMALPRIPPSHSLFSCLDTFVQLTALPKVDEELLLSVSLRFIEAIAKLIKDVVYLPTQSTSADRQTLEHFTTSLHHILSSVFPTLTSPSSHNRDPAELVVKLLDKIMADILAPLIHAYFHRSETYLRFLLLSHFNSANAAASTRKGEILKPPDTMPEALPADIRAEMLSLFKTTFCLVNKQLELCSGALSSPSHTLQASLILEAVRKIDQLLCSSPATRSSYSPGCGASIEAKQCHQMRRVKRLARKETLWYLCAILHVLFSEPSCTTPFASKFQAAPTKAKSRSSEIGQRPGEAVIVREPNAQGQQRLLNRAISDTFFGLITRCKRSILESSVQIDTQTGEGSQVEIDTLNQRVMGEPVVLGSSVTRAVVMASGVWHGDRSRHDSRHDGKNTDVGVDGVGFGVNAAGQGNSYHASVHPQGACELGKKEYLGEGAVALNEVEYGMLLGVIEHYWRWCTCTSWEF